jgi:hypothetical protein
MSNNSLIFSVFLSKNVGFLQDSGTMPRRKTLKVRIEDRMVRNAGDAVLLTRDFAHLGGEDQVLRAVRGLVREGRLVRVGHGVYGRAINRADESPGRRFQGGRRAQASPLCRMQPHGHRQGLRVLTVALETLVTQAIERLGQATPHGPSPQSAEGPRAEQPPPACRVRDIPPPGGLSRAWPLIRRVRRAARKPASLLALITQPHAGAGFGVSIDEDHAALFQRAAPFQ